VTSDRWAQVERIYHEALEREPGARAAFLEDACSGDDGLRSEVQSLLSYEDVHAATHSGAIPRFAAIGLGGVGAQIILAAWLISTTAQAAGAVLLMRCAVRGFDAAVGRPLRAPGGPQPS